VHIALSCNTGTSGVTRAVLTWLRRVGLPPAPDDPLAGFTEQERRILPLIAEGKTNREIAAALFLSEHTVKAYVSDLLKRLGLRGRTEAAAFIARHRGADPARVRHPRAGSPEARTAERRPSVQ
jgi:two-component system response regulator DevR